MEDTGWKSRKFWVALATWLAGTLIFFFTEKLTSDQWLLLTGVNGGGYGILNLLDKVVSSNSNKGDKTNGQS